MNEIRNTPLTKEERNRLYLRYLLFGCPGVDAIYIQGKSWPWWLLPFYFFLREHFPTAITHICRI